MPKLALKIDCMKTDSNVRPGTMKLPKLTPSMAVMRLPIFAILFISFFVSPEVVPLMAIAGVVALALTYDQPDFQDAAAAEDEDR